MRRGANLTHYVAEDLAGLARVALAREGVPAALVWVDELWPIVEANPALDGAEHPLQALAACYEILRAADDARAAPLLAELHARLRERAAKIATGAAALFLENGLGSPCAPADGAPQTAPPPTRDARRRPVDGVLPGLGCPQEGNRCSGDPAC